MLNVHAHLCFNTPIYLWWHICLWFLFPCQNVVSRHVGIPVAGPVWLGKRVLCIWIPVWPLGIHCLEVFLERYSSYTCQLFRSSTLVQRQHLWMLVSVAPPLTGIGAKIFHDISTNLVFSGQIQILGGCSSAGRAGPLVIGMSLVQIPDPGWAELHVELSLSKILNP